jgi:hypothetical protein
VRQSPTIGSRAIVVTTAGYIDDAGFDIGRAQDFAPTSTRSARCWLMLPAVTRAVPIPEPADGGDRPDKRFRAVSAHPAPQFERNTRGSCSDDPRALTCAAAARPPATNRTAGQLLDAQTADRPGDDQLLDLLGALEDVVGLLNAFGGSGYGQTLGFSSV